LRDLERLIPAIQHTHLLVVGDFLLDEFIFGEITRTSREAPVLILRYREREWRPGGGANTVAGVAALGARVTPVGVLGDDPWGQGLLSAWPDSVSTEGVVVSPEFQTTCKSRLLAGSLHSFRQQVVRLDYEHSHELSEVVESRLLENLERFQSRADAIIISDYSLGTISTRVASRAIEIARSAGIPIVADSRFHPERFTGATSVAPNISEVEKAASARIGQDDERLVCIGQRLLKEWALEALLITRGRLGMSLFEADRVNHIPAFGSDEVADVTGAGDTVTATYTASLATGCDFEKAARLANIAAGLVVTKKGTATVTGSELQEAIRNG
jgi:rfaE bifunctional protein kinase chain/domain